MFVAKITTAMTKASEKMFDTREKLGTLRGGRLKLRKKKILLGYEYVMVASSRKRRYSPCLLVAQSLNFLGKKNVKGALNPLLTIF